VNRHRQPTDGRAAAADYSTGFPREEE